MFQHAPRLLLGTEVPLWRLQSYTSFSVLSVSLKCHNSCNDKPQTRHLNLSTSGAAKGSSMHGHVKGRGANPKYICSTPEEAIVNR